MIMGCLSTSINFCVHIQIVDLANVHRTRLLNLHESKPVGTRLVYQQTNHFTK
jgi:hypothetical protein